MDNLTPNQRKTNMQHIRSDNTKIETILRKALWDKGTGIERTIRTFLENQILF